MRQCEQSGCDVVGKLEQRFETDCFELDSVCFLFDL